MFINIPKSSVCINNCEINGGGVCLQCGGCGRIFSGGYLVASELSEDDDFFPIKRVIKEMKEKIKWKNERSKRFRRKEW